jgi:hypothetical protein
MIKKMTRIVGRMMGEKAVEHSEAKMIISISLNSKTA